jgi:hypothetical protein
MFSDTLALTGRSLKKWIRDPAAIMPGLFMAVFWLALFGSSFNPVNLVPTQIGGTALSPVLIQAIKSAMTSVFSGAANYVTFLTAGVISSIVIINMAYGGIDIVLDRQLGSLTRYSARQFPGHQYSSLELCRTSLKQCSLPY